ncbi:hypothetical protein MARPO_0139s0026 [Marchantia polymorpha]|uniref:Uncharacterized protein n=1 Tax=Marchantia polymorpha TaxID=3197 RepID=A0A2R6W6S7_MARPO|nr:hypothetical protein MARPO_0139s0026 [Marchantia polymorpha]|eukprot:PTQ29557.1 hypothetical protein MARPO_0139s0026 [Marchantia polymorpha]
MHIRTNHVQITIITYNRTVIAKLILKRTCTFPREVSLQSLMPSDQQLQHQYRRPIHLPKLSSLQLPSLSQRPSDSWLAKGQGALRFQHVRSTVICQHSEVNVGAASSLRATHRSELTQVHVDLSCCRRPRAQPRAVILRQLGRQFQGPNFMPVVLQLSPQLSLERERSAHCVAILYLLPLDRHLLIRNSHICVSENHLPKVQVQFLRHRFFLCSHQIRARRPIRNAPVLNTYTNICDFTST